MKTFGDFGINTGGRSGTEIKVPCPQCSAARKKNRYPCLNLNTDKGVWHCWHCGWSGSLKAGEYDRPQIKREWIRPAYVENTTGLPEQVLSWFSARGITQAVLRRNQVGYGSIYMPQLEEEVTAIMFPYFRGSECINIKYRDGKKNFRMHGGAERVLYGLNDLADTLVWVEGEIDKLSLEVAGYPNCVSVPDGAPTPNTKNYSTKFDYLDAPELAKVQKHIIAVDNDAPGVRLKEELTRRLGAENCLIVTWPDGCKDANEVLVSHGSAVLSSAIEAAKPMPIIGAFEVSDFSEALAHHYEHGQPRGAKTGWIEVDECYSVRPGEWTLVTGIPGHGKSEWLDALMINLCASQGWGFGVCSFENQPPELHLAKMAEKYVGKPFNPGMNQRINATEYDIAVSWLSQHVTFILPEHPTIESILDVARQLVLRKGIRGLIIDPWNEIDHARTDGSTETEYVSAALSRIRKFARDNGVHVFLVAHPTKLQKGPDGKYPVPTPYDVSGSAHWRNKADNAISVWRDHMDEHTRDVEIHITKIRHKIVGKIGLATLKYDRLTGRYHGNQGKPAPIIYRDRVIPDDEMVEI